MGLFGKKIPSGPNVINIEDEILGNLDEIERSRASLTVHVKNHKWRSSIYNMDVKKKVLRIQDVEGMEEYNKKDVQCNFTLDRLMYVFSSKLFYSGGKPHLEIPEYLERKKQRKNPKITLSRRENVNVSAMEGLGTGVGVTGKAVDLTKDSITLTITRAMMMQNQKEVSPHMGLLKIGGELLIVKINKIPGCPVLECSANVVQLTRKGDWHLTIRLKNIPSKIQAAIEALIKERYGEPKPVKRSYKKRLLMEKEREERLKAEQEKTAAKAAPTNDQQTAPAEEPDISFTPKTAKPRFIKDESLLKDDPLAPSSIFAADPPAKETAPPVEEQKASEQLPMILSLGEDLEDQLLFLDDVEEFQWEHVSSPMKIIKSLNRGKTEFLMSTLMFKGQSMLEYLEKIQPMGVLKGVEIVIFSKESLGPKDLIKCRMLGINDVFLFPLEDPDLVLDFIGVTDSGQP